MYCTKCKTQNEDGCSEGKCTIVVNDDGESLEIYCGDRTHGDDNVTFPNDHKTTRKNGEVKFTSPF